MSWESVFQLHIPLHHFSPLSRTLLFNFIFVQSCSNFYKHFGHKFHPHISFFPHSKGHNYYKFCLTIIITQDVKLAIKEYTKFLILYVAVAQLIAQKTTVLEDLSSTTSDGLDHGLSGKPHLLSFSSLSLQKYKGDLKIWINNLIMNIV